MDNKKVLDSFLDFFRKYLTVISFTFVHIMTETGLIQFRGMPLFQRAKMLAPGTKLNNLQDIACFFYIVQGNYEAVESNGKFRITAKEALLKKCGNYIARFFGSEQSNECEAVAVYLYPDLLQELYKNKLPEFLKQSDKIIPPSKIVADDMIEKYMSNLFDYFDNPEIVDEELALHKVKELVMLLLRSEQYESVQQFLSELFSPGVLSFQSVIENNLYSGLSLEELAFVCNKSLSSFKREFNRVYKKSPAKYIKNRKLEKAAQLLNSTDEAISNIAYDCGFQDVTTFSATFHEKYVVAPSKYRATA